MAPASIESARAPESREPHEPVADSEAGPDASSGESERSALVTRMMEASRLIVAIAARTLAHIDAEVSMPQYRTLVVLDLGGPQRVSDLALELGVHPSTAGRMVERLVAKGFIRRQPGNDRRETIVRLTPRGARLTAAATKARREQFEELLTPLDEAELTDVARGLELIGQAGHRMGLTYLGDVDALTGW